MVSLTTKALGAGVAVVGLFLIIRGAGQKLDNLTNPLAGVELPSLPSVGDPIGGISSFFSNLIPTASAVIDDRSPVVIGQITENVNSPLIPTEEERLQGNESILQRLGLAQVPSLFDRPLNLASFIPSFPSANAEEADPTGEAQLNRGGFQGIATESPIGTLSLDRIIDRFNVTASQAANLRAISQDNFGDFDFGTNTSSGIGSVFTRPDINTELERGNVSNPEFEGLTASEIAQRLTGGNITNF